ncbi:MAG: hypothetical protein ACXADW_12750 [Candidatus Hodarchaeales archaeon]|jgi:hypothetical protein
MKKGIFFGSIFLLFISIISIGDLGSLTIVHSQNVGRLPGFEGPIVITGLFVLVAFAAYRRQE